MRSCKDPLLGSLSENGLSDSSPRDFTISSYLSVIWICFKCFEDYCLVAG
jgi:hypothetical protein